MTRTGRLGYTITRQFVWGLEVTNTSRTFRGTVTTPKNNGIVIRVRGNEIHWTGIKKGAVRKLRTMAHWTHQRRVVRGQDYHKLRGAIFNPHAPPSPPSFFQNFGG